MDTAPQSETERIHKLEVRMEVMAKEPDNLRAEFRAAILESEMRMKEHLDQRFVRLETRLDFLFKFVVVTQAAAMTGIVGLLGIAVRLLFSA